MSATTCETLPADERQSADDELAPSEPVCCTNVVKILVAALIVVLILVAMLALGLGLSTG